MARMSKRGRTEAFLAGLWAIQARRGLSDAALSREIGVDPSLVSRAKHDPSRTCGLTFAIQACDVFPELILLLFPAFPVGHRECPIGHREREEAAS